MSEQNGGAAPAGWYPDGTGVVRYWDGFAWTEHVAPAVAAEPVAAEPAEPARPAEPVTGRRSANRAPSQPLYKTPVAVVAAVVALLLVVGAGVLALGGKNDSGTSSASTPAAATPSATGSAASAPASVTKVEAVNCQPSTFPVDKYSWGLTLTVTPPSSPTGLTTITVASTGSIRNTGPTTIEPGKYRFEATVTVNGTPLQLIGPLNKTKSVGTPKKQTLYSAAELPIVATGTTPAPPAGSTLSVVLRDLFFNNINNAPTGDAKLTNTFDSRCNASPQPNTAPVPIGLSVPPAAGSPTAPQSAVTP